MQPGQLDLHFDGYESYWNSAEKKGYSGTAIFTRHQPLNVTYGIGIDEHDHEGRVITLEMEQFFEKLERVSEAHNCSFVLSISAPEEEVPEYIRKYTV